MLLFYQLLLWTAGYIRVYDEKDRKRITNVLFTFILFPVFHISPVSLEYITPGRLAEVFFVSYFFESYIKKLLHFKQVMI